MSFASPPASPLLDASHPEAPVRVYDVVVIGAGPSSLAVCARLCEQTPAALFTDEEHRRYHWIKSSPSGSRQTPKVHESANDAAKQGKRASTSILTPPASPRSSIVSSESRLYSNDDKESYGAGQMLGGLYDTLVLDASPAGQEQHPHFLARWKRLFSAMSIPHLRSPMFFHIDPSDRDSLLAFAHTLAVSNTKSRYSTDCIEIPGVVGRELSKHTRKQRQKQKQVPRNCQLSHINERERSDYRVPSSTLFLEHCRHVMDRYRLDERCLLQSAEVVNVHYDCAAELLDTVSGDVAGLDRATECVFRITCRDGRNIHSRAVVCAAGPGAMAQPGTAADGRLRKSRWPDGAASHSSQLQPDNIPRPGMRKLIKEGESTKVIVVGGGLTSAQLVDLLLQRGVAHVWMVVRGQGLRVKPFDVDLSWMGKYRNHEKATFWSADSDEERLQMVRDARGGGSIPAPWVKRLKDWEKKGKLTFAWSTIVSSIYSTSGTADEEVSASRGWRVTTSPRIEDLPDIDHVYFATGPAGLDAMYEPRPCSDLMRADLEYVPSFLQDMQRRYPMRWLGGLPALTDDLSWQCEDVEKGEDSHVGPEICEIPLYITGALAALRLGPGAASLEGARLGAERVAWALERLPWVAHRSDALPSRGDNDKAASSSSGGNAPTTTASTGHDGQSRDYAQGVGGRYGSLADLGE